MHPSELDGRVKALSRELSGARRQVDDDDAPDARVGVRRQPRLPKDNSGAGVPEPEDDRSLATYRILSALKIW